MSMNQLKVMRIQELDSTFFLIVCFVFFSFVTKVGFYTFHYLLRWASFYEAEALET